MRRGTRAIRDDAHLDAGGRWSVAGLPDCEWSVQLRSDRYAFDPNRVRFESGGSPNRLVAKATPIGALQLHGTLRDEQGAPLAGQALVCYTKRSESMGGGTPGRCRTDDDGRFRLDAPLSPGEGYTLHLVGSSHVLRQEKLEGHSGRHDVRYLVRYEDEADSDRALELVAAPAAFVRGRVLDDLGAPLPFRWCELKVGGRAMAYTYSLRDGSIAFPGVHAVEGPARIDVSLSVGDASSEEFTIAGLSEEVEIRAPATGRVHGRVVDAQGEPLIGVRLMIQNYHLDSGRQIDGSWTRVMTDRDGRYAFTGVAPTGHKVTLLDAQDDHLLVSELFGVGPGEDVEVDLQAPAKN